MNATAWSLLAMLTLASCSMLEPRPNTTRYAVLASVDDLPDAPAKSPASTGTLRIGLGPIALPEYLRRSAIVSRVDGTRITPWQDESWAEPFDRSLERVLAIDVQRALGSGTLQRFPWYEPERPELQIEIDFSRCECDQREKVVINCSFVVRRLGADAAPLARETRIERPLAGQDGAAVALALSEALASLGQEIAIAVREIQPPRE